MIIINLMTERSCYWESKLSVSGWNSIEMSIISSPMGNSLWVWVKRWTTSIKIRSQRILEGFSNISLKEISFDRNLIFLLKKFRVNELVIDFDTFT